MCCGLIYLLFLQLKLCVLSKRDMFRPAKLALKSVEFSQKVARKNVEKNEKVARKSVYLLTRYKVMLCIRER